MFRKYSSTGFCKNNEQRGDGRELLGWLRGSSSLGLGWATRRVDSQRHRSQRRTQPSSNRIFFQIAQKFIQKLTHFSILNKKKSRSRSCQMECTRCASSTWSQRTPAPTRAVSTTRPARSSPTPLSLLKVC